MLGKGTPLRIETEVMSKCHYVTDPIAGKVLIPGCWGTIHSQDMADCYCNSPIRKAVSEKRAKAKARELGFIDDSEVAGFMACWDWMTSIIEKRERNDH